MNIHNKNSTTNKSNIILGIDPGSTQIGYGVITYKKNVSPKALGFGYINLKGYRSDGERLVQLHEDLRKIIAKYKASIIALENIYFFKNSKTFSPVMQSKGVILFTAAQEDIKVYEYTPLQVKQTVCGYGRGNKSFLKKIVQLSLNISTNIKPDDASDALAIALCHFRHLTSN